MIHSDLTFKFTDTTVPDVVLGIVIDEKGNIRTNMKSDSTGDMSTASCDSSKFNASTYVNDGVQQYRIGTVSRAFTNDKTLSLRMVLANAKLGNINGALVGMNSNIKTSSSGDNIVIGGALLNVSNLLNLTTGTTEVTFKDSAVDTVKWASTLASFQKVYNTNNQTHTTDDIQLAKLSGDTLTFSLATCYTVKPKI